MPELYLHFKVNTLYKKIKTNFGSFSSHFFATCACAYSAEHLDLEGLSVYWVALKYAFPSKYLYFKVEGKKEGSRNKVYAY